MEPENSLFEKERDLLNFHFFGSMLFFRGVAKRLMCPKPHLFGIQQFLGKCLEWLPQQKFSSCLQQGFSHPWYFFASPRFQSSVNLVPYQFKRLSRLRLLGIFMRVKTGISEDVNFNKYIPRKWIGFEFPVALLKISISLSPSSGLI